MNGVRIPSFIQIIARSIMAIFFSSGKTNRDYHTLIQAAQMNSDLKFVIIGHLNNELLNIVPKNMKIIRSEANQTDTAISYSELKKYYTQSIAVCIPLNDDPDDTCGYTELLESMAMGKPVIKAKSYALISILKVKMLDIIMNLTIPVIWVIN